VSHLDDTDGCTLCGNTETTVHWDTPHGITLVAASCDEHESLIEALRLTTGPNSGLLSAATVELAVRQFDTERGDRIYGCRFCGTRRMTTAAAFGHQCPNVPAVTVAGVQAQLASANAAAATVGGETGNVIVALPGHCDRLYPTKPYQRAQAAIATLGWRITRKYDHWVVHN